MGSILIKWCINVAALFAVVHIVPGIQAQDWQALAVAALVLGLINAFLRPLIIILTLPINLLSLGIFTFFVNGFLFYLVSKIVKGFTITDFWSAFWASLLFSVVSFLLSLFFKAKPKIKMYSQTTSNFNHDDIIDIQAKEPDKKIENIK
jgi:putative membrane protein